MFRSAIARSLFSARAVKPAFTIPARPAAQFALPALSSPLPLPRFYSAAAGLTKPEVQGRIFDVLKNFDKVSDASKINETSHFTNDLGLDSLDTVEVVMAIEEEFSIEIPDKDADGIHSVNQAVEYILSQPEAH
ncbi:Acyl carrier protein-like protein [Ascosphaera apis ARSEF 7405]|uniref:Acyl carrier protein n=1 Tax=Ascosphaera apis ARSEF 7405 TaxID=392613 RepID=A0A166PI73_9EURO|nr:Acyl carrier protein-like protein [Ascosphaera apis ARSEF 7405]